MTSVRFEEDSLGRVPVPDCAYYGPQTARAVANFPISGITICQYPAFIQALAIVKKAAICSNFRLGDVSNEKATAISVACDEIIAGKMHDEFPVDVFQGGAGTSTNMNANEVIANRALEHLGFDRGRYDVIHPNNDVNLSQSTNDVYPTAMRLAILFMCEPLRQALSELADEFEKKALTFSDIIKLGRTQLQDAVPMTLGQEFDAFATALREDVARLVDLAALLMEINLGGTAIGTGINTDPNYQKIVIEELRRLTGFALVPASNLIEASWDTGAFVLFSSMLKRTATKLSKIASDLRLLSSGPRGGFGEITLPALQPGSSIMPGKINPVVPEVINQIAFQVIGGDLVVTLAAESGQLQLNAMAPVIAYNIFQSMTLLTNAARVFRDGCISGITANSDRCQAHLNVSTAIATALVPVLGYERATTLAKSMLKSGRTARELIEAMPGLASDVVDRMHDLKMLITPSKVRK
jgi:aspartate ammonia-lyase